MTSKVTQLFENPETMIEFIDRLGCSTVDQIAKRFGRDSDDVRKELNKLRSSGTMFSKSVAYSGWSDGIPAGGKVLVWATSLDRLPQETPAIKQTPDL
jgi:IS30 family transposase